MSQVMQQQQQQQPNTAATQTLTSLQQQIDLQPGSIALDMKTGGGIGNPDLVIQQAVLAELPVAHQYLDRFLNAIMPWLLVALSTATWVAGIYTSAVGASDLCTGSENASMKGLVIFGIVLQVIATIAMTGETLYLRNGRSLADKTQKVVVCLWIAFKASGVVSLHIWQSSVAHATSDICLAAGGMAELIKFMPYAWDSQALAVVIKQEAHAYLDLVAKRVLANPALKS